MAKSVVAARLRRTAQRHGSPVGRYLWRTYCSPDLVRSGAFGGAAALANLSTGWLLYGTRLLPGLPYWCATAAAAIGLVVTLRSIIRTISRFASDRRCTSCRRSV